MKENKNFKRLMVFAIAATMCLTALAVLPTASADPNLLYNPLEPTSRGNTPSGTIKSVSDICSSLIDGADYLKHAQADITEDNAGNGNPDSPDDPDDGGWDWRLTSPAFTHSTAASPPNIYGATAQGLYYAYLKTGDATYKTALDDAAGVMSTNAGIRSAADLIFLMLYDDLPSVAGTIYQDAAKAKYDARITTYGSATLFAEYIRDVRYSQGYGNGIIAWDIGAWARAAAMLHNRYPGNGYDSDADDIAEVIWQDSFNSNPGYFDIYADNGWDPTYATVDYWWYTLGITGLIDAFNFANVHTADIPTLISILMNCQYPSGAFSFSYGANTLDEDWQSTAYAVLSLAMLDQDTYQININDAGSWIASTQDVSGGWVYGSGNHYPEVGGENTAALYFGGPVKNLDTGETFCTIQSAIDDSDTLDGHTIEVDDGTYTETVDLKGKELTIDGAGVGSTIIDASAFSGYAISNFGDHTTIQDLTLIGTSNSYGFKISHASDINLENIRVENSGRTGVDLHTVDGATLTNIEVVDTVAGFGIMILDSSDIDVTNIMTDNNPWGGVSVHAVNANADSISFSGVFDANEPAPLLLEQDPPYGDFIDVEIPSKFGYVVYDYRVGPNYKQWYYQETLTDAKTFANALLSSPFTYSDMLIYDIIKENYYVIPGMLIQDAVDDATTGDTIHVDPGTFDEQVTIDKQLTVLGAGIGNTIITNTTVLTDYFPTSSNNYPVVYIHDVDGVTISDLTVDGAGNGNSNYRFVGIGIYQAGATLTNLEVINVRDTPFSGLQHGVAIYGWSDATGTSHTITIEDCDIYDYQKTGIALGGSDLTVEVDGCTVTGVGPTSVTAQNGIQVGYDATGSITGNTVTGCSYTGPSWAASGILPVFSGGILDISDNTIQENQANIYLCSCSADIDGNDIYATAAGTGQTYFYGIIGDPGNPPIIPDASPIDEGTPSTTKTTYTITCTGNTVESDGSSSGNTGIGVYAGMYGTYDIDFTATYNTVRNWEWGFELYAYAPSALTSAEIHYNNIEGNTYGVYNWLTTTYNATCNWWGDIDGPTHASNPWGSGDAVSDYVNYLPWLDDAYPDGDCIGGICQDIMWVDDMALPGWYDYTHVASIQTAVNRLCYYGTIYVSPGMYEELITIDKPLTMLGGTNGTCKKGYSLPPLGDYNWNQMVESIIEPPVGFEDETVVTIIDTDDVTFDGFIVQALERGTSGDRMLIHVDAHTQTLDNIVIINNVIGPNTNINSQDGTKGRMGLYLDVNQEDYGITNSLIECNKIFGCEGNGNNIFIWGSYESYSYSQSGPMDGTVIENNEIYGSHRSGIEIAGGCEGLTIRNNQIYGNSGLPTDDPTKLKYGNGILIIRGVSDLVSGDDVHGVENLVIEYNEIYDNEKNGIYIGPIGSDITINWNNFTCNGWDDIRIDLEGGYYEGHPNNVPVYNGLSNIVANHNRIEPCGICDHSWGARVIGTPTNGFVFDARWNWWAAPDGPRGNIFDAITGRPSDGLGEDIDGIMNFDPWAGVDAFITVSSTSVVVGTPVHFDGSESFAYHLDGTDSNFNVLWSFDDGFFSTEILAVHTYAQHGIYHAYLRVEAIDQELWPNFMYDWAYVTIYVYAPGIPLGCNAGGGGFDSYEGSVDEPIQFYGIGYGGTPPYSYEWDFGDGTAHDTVQNPIHVYGEKGTYTATLTIYDSEEGSATDTVGVTVYGHDELVANAGGPYNGLTDEAVFFLGSATGGVEPYNYVWDFGDGSVPLNGQTAVHTYEEIGTYTATLTVTDSEGNKDEHTSVVTIDENHHEDVEIKNIKGGLGIKATIIAGDMPVDWSISIDGRYVFLGGQASGNIAAHASETVRTPFSLGFGSVDITITAGSVVEERTGFMLGPFILSVKEA